MKSPVFACLTLLVCGCVAGSLIGCVGVATDGSVATLDVEKAIDNPKAFDLADIATDIEFIPLDDSNRDGLLGDIRKIAESKSGFYVTDKEWSAPVRQFDMRGNFVGTRGRIGRGPDEVIEISNMAVDRETDNVYIYASDGGSMFLLAYDSAGALFARYNGVGLNNGDLVFHDGSVVVLKLSPDNGENSTIGTRVPLLEMFSPDLKRESTIDAVDKGSGKRIVVISPSGPNDIGYIGPGGNVPGILSDSGKTLIAKEERSDTVFYYKNGVLEPSYILELGSHDLPSGAFGINPVESAGDSYAVLNIFESDRYLFVPTHKYKDDADVQLVFDRASGNGFSAVGEDGEVGLFLGGVRFVPCYIRDNRLVGYMQALDIVDNRDRITQPELKVLAATLKEESNPVIVVAKLRN
ncbi:MAG: 6-bladed beta-propeller [Alistipes sp.]|jgi:hypothetical protein|nr:6-bladed beta-propeller [Alistipes sp.]